VLLGHFPVFKNGLDSYKVLLKIENDKIKDMMENDDKRIRGEINRIKNLKEEKVKMEIERCLASLRDIEVGQHDAFAKHQRQEAIKTLRKLPMFGFNGKEVSFLPDFEWPTAKELMEMPLD
jgi:hypothetical protein